MNVTEEWWERRWLRRHALVAPFGIFAATLLLTYWKEHGQWAGSASLEPASGLVDLGAVLYAMAAVLAERGVRLMFWALDERRKWRAKAREEGHAEGHKEGRAEGHKEGRQEGYAVAKQEFDAQLQRIAQAAREQGVKLDDLPQQ